MSNIFNSDSWEIDQQFDSKQFNKKDLVLNDIILSKVKLKYLQPVYFDEEIRIDIEINGNLEIELNDKKIKVSSNKLSSKCILVKDGNVKYENKEETVSNNKKNLFKVSIEPNTLIKRFTIIQNLKIDGCNPNN